MAGKGPQVGPGRRLLFGQSQDCGRTGSPLTILRMAVLRSRSGARLAVITKRSSAAVPSWASQSTHVLAGSSLFAVQIQPERRTHRSPSPLKRRMPREAVPRPAPGQRDCPEQARQIASSVTFREQRRSRRTISSQSFRSFRSPPQPSQPRRDAHPLALAAAVRLESDGRQRGVVPGGEDGPP